MRQVEEKSKQTVWVLTMLTVMIVLSAYYMISDPIISDNFVDNAEDNSVDNKGFAIDLNTEEAISTEEVLNNLNLLDETGMSTEDIFVSLKMDRDNARSKQYDQLLTMLNSDISAETSVEINQKMDKLMAVEESELVLEKLIIADGYNDAVVLSNNNNVDVIIQTSSLSKSEAVRIIKMVSERLDIPAINVHIKTIKNT